MFHVNRGGDHRIYHNNNSAPATLKLLTFLFVIGLVGAMGWAFFRSVNQVTTAMGRTWTAGNNDHLISGWNTLTVFGGVVVIGLVTLAILPYLVANWQRAVNPSRERGDSYRVLDAQPGPQLLETDAPVGLLVDSQHEEKFLDVEYSQAENVL